MMVQAGAPQTTALNGTVAEFQKSSKVQMKLVEVPTGDMYQKFLVDAAGGGASYDLVTLDSIGVVGAGQYLEDLEALGLTTPDLKADFAAASIKDGQDVNGTIRGIPDFVTVVGLYYRTDLFTAKGLNPPTTWDQYVDVAQKLTDQANGIWGTAIQGSTKNAGGGVKLLDWLYQAGGGMADANNKPTINTPENAAALQFLADLVNKYHVASPDAPAMTHVEIHNLFLQGRAAMVDNWQYQVSLNRDPKQSKVVDNFGVAPLPMGKRAGGVLGNWFFCVPKASKNKDGAIAFAQFALTPAEQIRMTANEGVPARLSVMDTVKYPQIKEANPFLEPFRKMISETGFAQPKWVKLSDAYLSTTTALQKTILGQASPEQALAESQKEVEALVA